MIYKEETKNVVRGLRGQGKTYAEIKKLINKNIPKSTLSYWCKGVVLPANYRDVIKMNNNKHLAKIRILALEVNRNKRKEYLDNIHNRNYYLSQLILDKDTAKLMLTVLYWAEGGKNRKGALLFGNSDPLIIKLFLQLLQIIYVIDKRKFRCTLQCRADQNIKKLENFWSKVTGIPLKQFYGARIDPRTIGKPSKKKNYKGVCKIDYFSADIYNELTIISQILGESIF